MPADTNTLLDGYRADLAGSTTSWVFASVPASGAASPSVARTLLQTGVNVSTKGPGLALSSDGTRVLFSSERSDLVLGDDNSAVDVFANDVYGTHLASGAVAPLVTG